MASTTRFMEAIIAASQGLAQNLGGDQQAIASNMALNEVWMAYDWRETMGDFPPFYLNPSRQDYGPPVVAVPSDFFGLRRAYFWDLNSGGTQVPYCKELICVGDLPVTSDEQEPVSLCYYDSLRKFRVHPRPPSNYGPPYKIIDGKYKRRVHAALASDGSLIYKLTAAQLNNALLPLDDMFITVWIEALRWAMMTLLGAPKAGGVQIQNGVRGFVGQRAILQDAMDRMSDKEARELSAPPMAPQNSLVSINYW